MSAMKKVIERLQRENDSLKKHNRQQPRADIETENRKLKVRHEPKPWFFFSKKLCFYGENKNRPYFVRIIIRLYICHVVAQ